jgi:hypothetical protein
MYCRGDWERCCRGRKTTGNGVEEWPEEMDIRKGERRQPPLDAHEMCRKVRRKGGERDGTGDKGGA